MMGVLFWLLLAGAATELPAPAGPLVACAGDTTRGWVTVRDHRKALAFIAAVQTTDAFTEGSPFDCGLTVVARCAPDFDGDGKGDLLVRAHWGERYPKDGEEDSTAAEAARCHNRGFRGPNAPHEALFLLLTRDPRSPLGTARLLWDETGRGDARAAFTRWQNEPALRLFLWFIHDAPERAYSEKRERIVVLREGELVVVSDRQVYLN